jgi:pimeloyl-ACP methyl ester carboxylesterase
MPEGEPRPSPIVFVHGLWGAAWILRDWVDLAATRGWDAWAPNLRGREGSRHVDDLGKVRLDDLAADLHDVLDHVGDAVLVGYSMGGLVAQMLGGDPRVRALVLLCSVPPRGIVAVDGPVLRRSWRYLPAMIRGRPFMPNRPDADAMIMNRMTATERDHWFPRFIPDSGTVARQIAMGAAAVDPATVTCPVLVISAQHDHISPPGIQPALVRRYRAEHLPVAGRGHLISIERGWEATANAVLDWAERALS